MQRKSKSVSVTRLRHCRDFELKGEGCEWSGVGYFTVHSLHSYPLQGIPFPNPPLRINSRESSGNRPTVRYIFDPSPFSLFLSWKLSQSSLSIQLLLTSALITLLALSPLCDCFTRKREVASKGFSDKKSKTKRIVPNLRYAEAPSKAKKITSWSIWKEKTL